MIGVASSPGLPRSDFISQPWRKIRSRIFLQGCEIKSARGRPGNEARGLEPGNEARRLEPGNEARGLERGNEARRLEPGNEAGELQPGNEARGLETGACE